MADFRPQDARPQPPPAPTSPRRWLTEVILLPVVVAVAFHATVAEARYIPSESMTPTLAVGDRLIVEKLSPHLTVPNRGDILVFYPPASHADGLQAKALRWLGFTNEAAYIKRVVALPGETIAVRDGRVFIDGVPLDEPYLLERPEYTMDAFRVPEGHLFMLGDNRNNSQDSHVWGALPVTNVIGHAAVRFWPLDRLGTT